MEKIVTVDYLLDLLKKLSEDGRGDMKIKCKDGFLHEDEILVNYFDNEMELRGCIYNIDAWEAIKEFYKEIEGARLKFYEALMRNQRAEE